MSTFRRLLALLRFLPDWFQRDTHEHQEHTVSVGWTDEQKRQECRG